ncbi:flagellin [Mangrovicella endophytica]|uniref:flagellin N-terminal helical domain-containing protein n=1 Tax=Mangrovicella endophytica TaxID=2066697 RepID=UPI000C9DFAA7|nr:flagellin [Mangrovicella endophytica]
MTSVLYNGAATTALRVLQNTNSNLDKVQNHISTGLKIGEAKDNAAYWSISTTLKSDNKSLSTVKDALGLGAATVDVAYKGLNESLKALNEIKSKLTSATQAGVDRAAVQADIDAYQNQLTSIANASVFSGENWLSIDSDISGTSKQVVASYSRNADNTVEIGTINIDLSSTALFDAGGTGKGILNSQSALISGGTYLTVGGNNAASVPTTTALAFGAQTGGAAVSNGSARVVSLGTLDISDISGGDTINFNLTVGGVSGAVKLATDGLNESNFVSRLNQAIVDSIGASKAIAAVDPATKEVTISTVATGTSAAITVGAVTGNDGDGNLTALGGLFGAGSYPLPTVGTGAAAVYTGGARGTSGAGDTLAMTIQYGSRVVNVSQAITGAVTNDATFISELQTTIDTAMAGAGYTAGDIIVGVTTGGNVTLTTKNQGAEQAIGVTNVVPGGIAATLGFTNSTAVSYGSSAAATMTVGTFDNTDLASGDKIKFNLNVNGTVSTITVDTAGLVGTAASAAADKTLFAAKVQGALDAVFTGANRVNFDIAAGGAMTLTTVKEGSTAQLAISGVRAEDGDGTTTHTAGLTVGATTGGAAGSPGTVATITGTGAFSGTQTFGAKDKVTFKLTLDSTEHTVTVDKAAVVAAGFSSGTISSASDYATVLNSVFAANSIAATASDDGAGHLVLEKASNSGAGTIAVSGVSSNVGADTISVAEIDINSDGFKALTDSQKTDVLKAYISVVNDAISKVTAAAAALGSVSSRIDLQKDFVTTLIDTIDAGVSGLVDADMNEESTRLQALQVQQQLGVQALSIANQSAQNVLSLFR